MEQLRRLRREPDTAWTIESLPDRVSVRIPILGDAGDAAGSLVLLYLRDDPLVVQLQVCAPSGGLVLDREILRCDLREAHVRTRCNATLTVGPDVPGSLRATMHEGPASVHLVIPADAVVLLLRGADALVPPAREDDEIDRLLDEELRRSRTRAGRAAPA